MPTTERDAERLFAEFYTNSADREGGVTRPSYSVRESTAMMIIAQEAETAGLKVAYDSAANLHVTLGGTDPGLPRVLCGSHLDSVPQGGNYDGAAGVLAGLIALINIAKSGKTPKRSIGLLALRGEESAWFGKCYLGSRALFGLLSAADFDRPRRDDKGTLDEYVRAAGGSPAALRSGAWILDPKTIAAFLELHIEQGPVLENAGAPLGIVTGIRGNIRYTVTIVGEAGHSGTVPMGIRRDAVSAFADFLVSVRAMAKPFNDMVLTVGRVHTDADKDSVSTIPDKLTFSLEWRSQEHLTMISVENAVMQRAVDVGLQHGVQFMFQDRTYTPPAKMDERIQRILCDYAAGVMTNQPFVHRMPSGAGHDAAVFAQQGVPTGMIFIRNQHGSHNPKEAMRLDDFALGVEVLERTLVELANEDPR